MTEPNPSTNKRVPQQDDCDEPAQNSTSPRLGQNENEADTSNKRAKRDAYLQFRGRKGPRVGSSYQVSILPSPHSTGNVESPRRAPAEPVQDDDNNGDDKTHNDENRHPRNS